MRLFFIVIFLCSAMAVSGKSDLTDGAEMSLKYLVRQPKIKIERPPLIILLHGVGSNENDLFSFADQLPDSFLVISARAPYEQAAGSYAWYQVGFASGKPAINAVQAEESRNTIINFISQLKEKYTVDTTKIFLCGFSQGAIMSYSVGLTRPDEIKGIAIMSGRLLEEVKPLVAPGDQLKNLHVFINHGTHDNVLDIHYARESKVFLEGLGINPEYREYPEGHTISREMLADMINWLHRQQ